MSATPHGPPASRRPAQVAKIDAQSASTEHAGGTPAVQEIRAILANVPDPEIPAVSVIDLGIVREVTDDHVTITPTYTGCPATIAIEQSIREALDANGFSSVAIETTLSPPWSTDWISEKGREDLRAYGIAPPPKGAASASLNNQTAAECPQCGSSNTEELSRFGQRTGSQRQRRPA